jgi:trimeric autotransporter adhesin
MKTFKKTLCLVLALVMIVGTLAMGASADFKDSDKVTYKEAVDVLVGIGTINGDENGYVNPTANLDRASAAKIVAYLVKGKTAADSYSKADTFKDVSRTHWASSYINWAVGQSYLAGDGTGNFLPSGALTGHAFAKMLLCALGYNAKAEGYLGDDWKNNVEEDANEAGLVDGIDNFDYAAVLNRETACQMAFNTLKATMVKYTDNGITIEGDGFKISTDAKREDVKNTSSGYRTNYSGDDGAQNDGLMQFCEKYYSDLALSIDFDDFYRPANIWTYDGDDIGTYADEAEYTATSAVKSGDLYTALKLSAEKKNVIVYTDGNETSTTFDIVKKDKTELGGNGTLLEVYKVNGDYRICLINTYLGKISKVDENKDDETYVSVKPESVKPSGIGATENYVTNAFDDADKDEYVLYTYAITTKAIHSVKLATLEEDLTVTSSKSNTSFTAGGKTYEYSEKTVGDPAKYEDEIDIILDDYGYVIYTANASADDTYAVVLATDVEGGKYVGSSTTHYAQLLFTDGKVEIVEAKANYSAFENQIVKYSVKNDVYTLIDASAVNYKSDGSTVSVNETTNIEGGKISFTVFNASYKGNAKTIYLVASVDKDGDYTFKSYTGYRNVVDVTVANDTDDVYASVVTGDTYAKVVYVLVADDAIDDGTSSSNVLIAAASADGPYKDSAYDGYYTINAIVDGRIVETMIDATEFDSNNSNKLYKTVGYDGDVIDRVGTEATYTKVSGDAEYADDIITLNQTEYVADKDIIVFYIDEDGVITSINVDDIDYTEVDAFVVTDTDSGEVTELYIFEKSTQV